MVHRGGGPAEGTGQGCSGELRPTPFVFQGLQMPQDRISQTASMLGSCCPTNSSPSSFQSHSLMKSHQALKFRAKFKFQLFSSLATHVKFELRFPTAFQTEESCFTIVNFVLPCIIWSSHVSCVPSYSVDTQSQGTCCTSLVSQQYHPMFDSFRLNYSFFHPVNSSLSTRCFVRGK